MSRILVLTSCPTGTAHSVMAAEALKAQGKLMGHVVRAGGLDAQGRPDVPAESLSEAEAVVVASDGPVDSDALAGRPHHVTSTARAIRDPAGAFHAALATRQTVPPPAQAPKPAVAADSSPTAGKTLVAITACPTGIAHTFMAAEALRKQAEALGHAIAIETQGSVGAKNKLSAEAIAAADAVIIAADTAVDTARFAGKRVYHTDTGAALKRPREVIDTALALPEEAEAGAREASYAQEVARAKQERSEQRAGPYKHLLTGVSYMLPIVVAGGLLIALSFVWGIEAFQEEGTIPAALMSIGGGAAFALMVPVLSGFIAYSIADRPGLAPGLIGGMLAAQLNAGFLGGIVSGFIAGYSARWLRDKIRLHQNLEGLKPVLIIPLLATAFTGLLMIYVVGAPVSAIMTGLTNWLGGLSATNAVILGLILGGMMAVDMGGPVNKAAYTFSVGLLGSDTFGPMAATMAAGMVPPLALSLATFMARNKFNADERQAGKAAGVLGLCFITEGAIPFAAKDPIRVIPAAIAGAALTGALSMLFGCTLRAPHGGVFVLGIPNAVGNLGLYIVAILAGTVLTAAILAVIKPRVAAGEPVPEKVAKASAG